MDLIEDGLKVKFSFFVIISYSFSYNNSLILSFSSSDTWGGVYIVPVGIASVSNSVALIGSLYKLPGDPNGNDLDSYSGK